jgi:hypothetical protein
MLTEKYIESPCNAILGIAQKFILSRVLMLFAELKLGEILKDDPITLEKLSKKLNVNPIALRRFMRLLTAHHIVRELGNDTYASTVISHYFSALLDANLINDYNELDKIIESLKTHEKPLSERFSAGLYKYLNQYDTQVSPESQNDLINIAREYILAKIVMSAAELNLGVLLKQGPLPLDALALKFGISSQTLYPYLQILSAHGIIEEVTPSLYQSTPLSDCLDRVLSPHILDAYKVFNGALHTLQTNSGAWAHVFGKNFYDYLNQHADKLEIFNVWCMQSATDWLPPILSLCHFPLAKNLVDVGGGRGHFVASILQKNPHMEAVLFDQPSVIDGVEKSALFKTLKNRARFVGGDFFKSVPAGGDIYTICRALLNWSDEHCIQIINNCHKAMNSSSKLWIIDFIVPSPDHPKYPRAVVNDISLFLIVNSAIRTEHEWRILMSKTLFSISNIFITEDGAESEPFLPMCIIEATPKLS